MELHRMAVDVIVGVIQYDYENGHPPFDIKCNTISSGETQRSEDKVETKWRPSGYQVDTTGYHWIPADTKWISIGYQMDTKWMLN
eukprot:scaffold4731_cov153-Skeletonema_marinoi.AAC.1